MKRWQWIIGCLTAVLIAGVWTDCLSSGDDGALRAGTVDCEWTRGSREIPRRARSIFLNAVCAAYSLSLSDLKQERVTKRFFPPGTVLSRAVARPQSGTVCRSMRRSDASGIWRRIDWQPDLARLDRYNL